MAILTGVFLLWRVYQQGPKILTERPVPVRAEAGGRVRFDFKPERFKVSLIGSPNRKGLTVNGYDRLQAVEWSEYASIGNEASVSLGYHRYRTRSGVEGIVKITTDSFGGRPLATDFFPGVFGLPISRGRRGG